MDLKAGFSATPPRLGALQEFSSSTESCVRTRVMDHLESHLHTAGRIANVVAHEVMPYLGSHPMVHCHAHGPSEQFPYYTFVTEGLSVHRMPVPAAVIEDWGVEAQDDCAHVEFVVYARKADVEGEVANGSDLTLTEPAKLVRHFAHTVQEHNVWVWSGHTMLFTVGELTNVVLVPVREIDSAASAPGSFGVIPAAGGVPRVTFFALVPLTAEEMCFKRSQGGLEALLPFIGDAAINPSKSIPFYVDFQRSSAQLSG